MTSQPVDDTTPGGAIESIASRVGLNRRRIARLVKFGAVGVVGVVVNWVFFEFGYYLFGSMMAVGPDAAVAAAYVVGLLVSIFTNFIFNDIWTWADREKGGWRDWWRRLAKYYISASVAGAVQFGMSWLTLKLLWSKLGWALGGHHLVMWGGWTVDIPSIELAPRLGLLTGIACGMAINFLASHLWTFRDAEPNN